MSHHQRTKMSTEFSETRLCPSPFLTSHPSPPRFVVLDKGGEPAGSEDACVCGRGRVCVHAVRGDRLSFCVAIPGRCLFLGASLYPSHPFTLLVDSRCSRGMSFVVVLGAVAAVVAEGTTKSTQSTNSGVDRPASVNNNKADGPMHVTLPECYALRMP